MDYIKSFFKKIIIVYLVYLLVFGLLIYKLPIVVSSNIEYDTDLMMTPSDANSYAYLVEDVDEAMDIRLGMIEQAVETIDVSYYKYLPDKAGEIFSGALLKRADEGIKIRIIVDGNSFSKGKMFKTLNSHENITYLAFETNSLLLVSKFHNVLHDKLLLIDENYGIIGGRNISNRFLDSGNRVVTLDRDVLVYSSEEKSEAGIQMKDYFDELESSKYTKLFQNKYKESYGIYKEEMINLYENHRLNGYDFQEQLNLNGVAVERVTFVRGPLNRFTKEPIVYNVTNELMKSSNDIVIQSPYILKSYMMEMYFSTNKEKNVTLITNNMGTNPNLPSLSGYVRNRKKLAANYNLYELQKDKSIHAKSITIGNDISIIGSQNMDHRSMFLSTESQVVIYSEEFQDKLNIELNYLKDNSLKVNADGSYETKEGIIPIKNSIIKRIFVRISSFITAFFNEMLLRYIQI